MTFFRPGDRQMIQSLYTTYDTGRTGIQIGNNTNLMDWTYVMNVADAHILAADKLVASAKIFSSPMMSLNRSGLLPTEYSMDLMLLSWETCKEETFCNSQVGRNGDGWFNRTYRLANWKGTQLYSIQSCLHLRLSLA